MGGMNEDRFLDEIDAELRTVGKRVKKIISSAEAVLQEFSGDQDLEEETDGGSGGQTWEDRKLNNE